MSTMDPGRIPPPISPSLGKYVAPQTLKGTKGADLPIADEDVADPSAAAPAVGAGSGRVFTKLADSIMPVLRRIQHAVGAVLSLSKPEWLNNAAVIRKLDGRADFLSGQLEKMDKGEMSFADASRIKAELKEIKAICSQLEKSGVSAFDVYEPSSKADSVFEQIDAGQLEIISSKQYAQYAEDLKGLVAAVKYNYGLNPKFLEEGSKAEKRLNKLLEDIDKHLANEKSMTNDELVAISNEILEDILGAELRKIGVKAVPLEIKIEAVALRNQLNEIQRTKIPAGDVDEEATGIDDADEDDDVFVDAPSIPPLPPENRQGLVDDLKVLVDALTDGIGTDVIQDDSPAEARLHSLVDQLETMDDDRLVKASKEIVNMVDDFHRLHVASESNPKNELIEGLNDKVVELRGVVVELESTQKPDEAKIQERKQFVANMNTYVNTVMKEYKFDKMKDGPLAKGSPGHNRLQVLLHDDYSQKSEKEIAAAGREIVDLLNEAREHGHIEKIPLRIQEQGRAFHKQLDAYEGRWSSII